MATRLLAGCTTGAVAVACAQPTDVVKVRFQASRIQSDSARRYSSTVDAYRTIAREEGVRGLWRGTLPNIARNAIINCGELVTYDLLKDALLRAELMSGEDGSGGHMARCHPCPCTIQPLALPHFQTTSRATSWPPSAPGSAPRWWHPRWTW